MTQTHKLVPIEPTDEMLKAMQQNWSISSNHAASIQFQKETYKAMLSSAPEVGEAVACAVCGHQTTYCSDCGVEVWKPAPDRTAQLEEIYGYVYQVNDTYTMFSYKKPPEDAYDEGTLVAVSRTHNSIGAQLEAKLSECDEEIERLQSYEQGLNDVIAWMKERGLYHDADYFGDGADFAAILTEHEQQVSAYTEREIKKDNKRLVEALKANEEAILFEYEFDGSMRKECSHCNSLPHADSCPFGKASALLAEMEAKG